MTKRCTDCENSFCSLKGSKAVQNPPCTHPPAPVPDGEKCSIDDANVPGILKQALKDIKTEAYREGYHDGEVVGAKQERDRVLDELCSGDCITIDHTRNIIRIHYTNLQKKIESLRSSQQEQL
jgi:hypothetical protein